MTKSADPIDQAKRLISARKYPQAKQLLLTFVLSNPRNAYAYSLLSHATILARQYEEAKAFVEKALFISPLNVEALLAQGFLALVAGNIEEALRAYLRVQEIEPLNATAKANIERIRRIDNIDEEIAYLNPGEYLAPPLLPDSVRGLPFVPIGIGLAVIVILVAVALNFKAIRNHFAPAPILTDAVARKLKEIYLFEGRETNSSAVEGGYTPKAIVAMFETAKRNIHDGDLNKAIVIINAARRSTMNPYLKERFFLLTNFMRDPDYATFSDTVAYETVMKDPVLYEGAYLIWQGTVNDIHEDGRSTVISMLAKKPRDRTVTGMVDVIIEGSYAVRRDQRIEIYGRVSGFDIRKKRLVVQAKLLKHLLR
ncbi:MAG: hypothetical protein HZC28_02140 [Spirochaetes bacterium]|nr:hypothetical protein [Spirochaetota bacterium]